MKKSLKSFLTALIVVSVLYVLHYAYFMWHTLMAMLGWGLIFATVFLCIYFWEDDAR